LKRLDLDENISKEGTAESGVCRSVRVVNDMVCKSDGSGPVTVGYSPVQYDIVVVMLGDGKTKLTAASPNEITLVTARKRDKDVAFRPEGEGGVTTGEVLIVDANVEVRVLGETAPELERDIDAVVSVWMLTVPSVEVELPRRKLGLGVKLVMVFDINNVEDDVKFLIIEDEEFVLGNRVGNTVEVLETSMLVKGVLKECNDEVELDVRIELSEEADGAESDRVDPVGSVIEMLFALLVCVGFELIETKLPDVMPEFVPSNEVRVLDDVLEELPVLLARLGLGLGRFEVLKDGPAGEDVSEEGLGRDTEESKEIVVLVVSEVNSLGRIDVHVVRTLEVSGRMGSDVGCEDMPPSVLEGRLGLRPGRLLDGMTDGRPEIEGVERVDGKTSVDSVVTTVESSLLVVTTVVDTENDGYGLCGWLIGRGKSDVSDDVGPDEDKLTDDKANEDVKGLLPKTLVPIDDPNVNPEVNDDVNVAPGSGVEGLNMDSADVVAVCVDDAVAAPDEDVPIVDNEETIGVISAVRVTRVLKRLGGEILLSHSVVPLMTEK
jgi:hypothetical protein